MSGREVPATRTKLVPRELAAALDREFEAQGHPLAWVALPLICALVWIETGGNVTCFNLGNFAAGGFVNGKDVIRWAGKFWRPPWFWAIDEGTPETDWKRRMRYEHGRMLAGRAPSAFRAYDSIEEGVRDFVRGLLTMFPNVVAMAETGRAELVVDALRTEDPRTGRRYSEDYNRGHVSTFESIVQRMRLDRVFDGLSGGYSSGGALGVLVLLGGAAALAWRKGWL